MLVGCLELHMNFLVLLYGSITDDIEVESKRFGSINSTNIPLISLTVTNLFISSISTISLLNRSTLSDSSVDFEFF